MKDARDRRSSRRAGVEILLNKYIDGYPHTCRAIDLSMGGVLVNRIHEPQLDREFYSLQLGLPGEDPIWVWSRPVWTKGSRQALRFVSMEAGDRARLARYLGTVKRAA